jgi:hypothetical protein
MDAIGCVLLDRAANRRPSAGAETFEPLALRHGVRVLLRQVLRLRWRPGDRLLLAALCRRPPRRERWRLSVRPETLIRWHCRPARPFGARADPAPAGRHVARIPDDGDRYRRAAPGASAFVEPAVDHVVSKRMVERQQLRWTPPGARLLLQVRTRVVNDDLAGAFRRWFPAFRHTSDRQRVAASPRFVPVSFTRR